MRSVHGKILMGTGILHSGIVAPLIYFDKWREFLGKGFFNLSPHSRSETSFVIFSDITSEAAIWFFIGGVLFFVIGHLLNYLENKMGRLPSFIGWELLLIGLVFAWMLPESGFTLLVIPQALFILIRSRSKSAAH